MELTNHLCRRGRRATLASVTLLLTGCFWPAPGAGPGRQAHNPFENQITPTTVGDLEEAWSMPTPGPARHPVTSNNAVHVTVDSALHSYDRTTGDELWGKSFPAWPDWVPMGPAHFANDAIWMGFGIEHGGGGFITELLDPQTGDTLTELSSSGHVDSVRGGTYILSRLSLDPGSFDALDIVVGSLDAPDEGWSGLIDVTSNGQWAPLTLGQENAYNAGHGMVDIDPLTQGNGVRAFALDERQACQEPFEFIACPTWGTVLDGTNATSPVLTADGSTLYTATNAGTVYAVAAADGTIEWSASVGSAVLAEPALANGKLYVPTKDGQLMVLDATDGTVLWLATAGDAIDLQPAVAGGLVYTGATDGAVRAFDAAGCGQAVCQPLWSTSAGAAITGAPAVSQGKVYIGTTNSLIAYGLPTED